MHQDRPHRHHPVRWIQVPVICRAVVVVVLTKVSYHQIQVSHHQQQQQIHKR